ALYAATWLDLAEAHRACKNADVVGHVANLPGASKQVENLPQNPEVDALKRSVELAPAWDIPRKWLVDAHERAKETDQARAVLDQAIARAPLVGLTYVDLAEFLWRQNEHDEAIKQVRHALKLDPGMENAWNDLCNWCAQLDRYQEVFEVARGWTTARPGEARSWMRLGQALQWQSPRTSADSEKRRVDECAAAYDEALKRNPIAVNIH